MSRLRTVLWLFVLLCAFLYGFFVPMLIPQGAHEELTVALGKKAVYWSLAGACGAALSAVTMWIMAHAATRQPRIILLLVKLFVFALPAIAIGVLVSLILALLGVLQIEHPGFYAACAIMFLCAGVSGIIAVNLIPEYGSRNRDRTGLH